MELKVEIRNNDIMDQWFIFYQNFPNTNISSQKYQQDSNSVSNMASSK